MRTLTDATLFTVNGPRGCYFAVRNHDTGVILTERTESAAAGLANESDLVIVDQREISHAELLEMTAARCADDAPTPPAVHADRSPGAPGERTPGLLQFARRLIHRDPQTPGH